MLSQWLLTGSVPVALCTAYHHDTWLVVASYAVATFASYTAFHLVARVRAATTPAARYIWLATTGLSMGCGIWAMQFIAMLAVDIPIAIGFDLKLTFLSAAVVAMASAAAFAIVTQDVGSRLRLVLAGVVLGGGTQLMHGVGMAALRMPADLILNLRLLALSTAIAVILATAALWALVTLPRLYGRRPSLARATGAAVMGAAIVLTHYTGVLAACFHADPGLPAVAALFDRTTMAAAVGAAALLIVGLARIAALFDQRVERANDLLHDAVNSISEGFVIYDREDRMVMCNEAYRRHYRNSVSRLVPGVAFKDILRLGLDNGEYLDARGREEDWLAERLAQHRAATGAVEQQLSDGSWLLVAERRMANGGIAGLRIDISRLKAAQAAFRDSELRLDRAQEMAGIGSWEIDVRTGRRIWSKEMYRIRGTLTDEDRPTLEGLGQFTHPDDRARFYDWMTQLREGMPQLPLEYRILRPDGQERVVVADGQPVIDDTGTCTKVAGTLRDITERRHTEQQLLQAQKMETVGQLTGGLAHDFNNILGAVIGNLDLAAEGVAADSDVAGYCQIALDAALGGAELVKSLLAFSRRQALRPGPANVEQAIGNVLPLVRPTLGERIRVQTLVAPNLWAATTDTAQFESAILNLIVNARDAMPRGGVVLIEAANAVIDRHLATASGELPPGDYVVVAVRDNGAGMTDEVMARAVEPFFTTKPPGAGSGLGLSMVFGTMQQLGGAMHIDSVVAVGTTVRLYLPRAAEQQPAPSADTAPLDPLPNGHERILLVEDNAQIRALATRTLRSLGYQVTVADNGDEAAHHVEAGTHFDMLFTDIVMPGHLNGIALAGALRARDPSTRVLFTSGFSSPAALRQQVSAFDAELIPKPYRRSDLALVVRAMLDQVGDAVA
jgi:PAS domain S-box-containing protein